MAGTVGVSSTPYELSGKERASGLTRGLSLPLVLILGVGVVLRCLAALRLPMELDEQNSLLALQVVTERGLPILPSGVLYLHGAVVSYLLAPLQLLGLGSLDNLFPLRFVSVLLGTATIFVTYRLALLVGGAAVPALVAAALLAIDPLSIYWSAHVRMYAYVPLFSALAVLFFLQYILPVAEPDATTRNDNRHLVWMVVMFWLAVFSHLSAALLWPALAAVALVRYGRDLLGPRRSLSLALGACLLAPLTLVGLTTIGGRDATTQTPQERDWIPGLSFLGDQNIDLTKVTNPSLTGWTELFISGPLATLVPIVVVALSGVLIGRYLVGPMATPDGELRRNAVGTIIAVYWIPVLLFAFFSPAPQPRYFLFLQPVGVTILGLGLGALVGVGIAGARLSFRPATVAAIAVVALLAIHSVAGAWSAGMNEQSLRGDLRATLQFVQERHQPGELILVSQAPISYLVMGDAEELRFLPGAENSLRAQRYAKRSDEESATDYWIGIPAIASTLELCQVLTDNPHTWIVVDKERLGRRAIYGPMTEVIIGSSDELFSANGGLVFYSRPAEDWDNKANRGCRKAAEDAAKAETPTEAGQ